MQKPLRELKKRIEDLGLRFLREEYSGSGNVFVHVEAANGQTKRFTVSKNPKSPQTVRNQEQWFRQFAKENPAPQGSLQAAIARASSAGMKVVHKLTSPTSENTPPTADFYPAAPTPAAEPAPAPAASTEKNDMSIPAQHEHKTRKPPASTNKLDTLQTVQLADWIRAYDFKGKKPTTYAQVLADARTALPFQITTNNILGMMSQLGYQLSPVEKPKKVVPPTDNEIMLARQLREVMGFVNFLIPSAIDELASAKHSDD